MLFCINKYKFLKFPSINNKPINLKTSLHKNKPILIWGS